MSSFRLPQSTRTQLIGILTLLLVTIAIVVHQTLTHYPRLSFTLQSPHHEDFVETSFDFQEDLTTLRQPKTPLAQYAKYPAHNYNPSFKQATFATYLCTRNASIHDPYFSATLNLIYRNLWSPISASKFRPFTVFVAPFITQEQRDILSGAGAIVQELDLLPWEPNVQGVYARWRDQFSKLHFWNQTQYSTIAYMDSDAFPLQNIDDIFDLVTTQTCGGPLTFDELVTKDALCAYKFAGVPNWGGGVNGGFLVLSPNEAMHARLLRNYVKVDEYDNSVAEQSFLKWMFKEDGAFPVQMLPRMYNTFFPTVEDEGEAKVVHEKIWRLGEGQPKWLEGIWEKGWEEMVDFFDTDGFRRARMRDGGVDEIAGGLW